MARRKLIVLALVLIPLAIPTTVFAYHRVWWFTPDGQAIKRTLVQVEYAYHAFDEPPAPYHRGAVPAAVLRHEESQASALSHRLYTGRMLSSWLSTYRAIIERQGARGVDVAWTLTRVDAEDLSFPALAADATVRTTSTSSLGQVSVWDEEYHLVRTSSGWRIDRMEDGHCISGCP